MLKLTGTADGGGGGANPLGETQQKVLALKAQGLTNTEVASQLVISENTVRAHIRDIRARMEIYNLFEAAITAKTKGWIK